MEEYDELTQDVMRFIAKQRAEKLDDLYPDMRLSGNLGIGGDDAEEILLEFCKQYKVDATDFEFLKYFSPEGEGGCLMVLFPFILIYWPIYRIITHKNPKFMRKIPLTIQDLVNSAQTGKLHSLATEPE